MARVVEMIRNVNYGQASDVVCWRALWLVELCQLHAFHRLHGQFAPHCQSAKVANKGDDDDHHHHHYRYEGNHMV